MLARTGEELLKICEEESISLSEYAIRIEMRDRELSREEVYKKMAKNLKVMKEGATEGREKQVNSLSGLIGGDGYRVQKYLEKGNTLTGDITVKAMAMALSSSEVNASMGRIVACPTAGSCGILPAVILSAGEKLGKSDEELIDAFLDMVENHKLVAENSGLLTIAALKHLKCTDKKIVSIISGGNMDIITMSSTLQHGLIQRGRVFTVSVLLPDKPGELVKVANKIAEQQGNVIKLEHNQFVSVNRNAAVELKVTLECFGHNHKEQILKALNKAGYNPKEIAPSL